MVQPHFGGTSNLKSKMHWTQRLRRCHTHVRTQTSRSQLSLPVTEELQQEQKELDDIEVKVEGRHDVIVRAELVLMFATDDQLCVVDKEHREDERTRACIDQAQALKCGACRAEEARDRQHEAEAHEYQDSCEEVGPHAGEIDGRLACEQGEAEDNDGSDAQDHDH